MRFELQPEKITLIERDAIRLYYNLADAQVYIAHNAQLSEVWDNLDQWAAHAFQTNSKTITETFLEQFYAFRGLHCYGFPTLLCYSASIAIEICANFIRSDPRFLTKKVGMIHPTFDAAFYIMNRHALDVVPIDEALLASADLAQLLRQQRIEVLYLTLPNNPTGFQLASHEFEQICSICESLGVMLIVDACFRFYSADQSINEYATLTESALDFVLIEDTGKLLNLLDVKAGLLRCNADLLPDIRKIHSDFLLEVSKFSLTVITAALRTVDTTYRTHLLNTIADNRMYLIERLYGYGYTPIGQGGLNVQLFETEQGLDGKHVENLLKANHIGILNASGYFWDRPAIGKKMIRIALARNEDYFKEAVDKMCALLESELHETDQAQLVAVSV